MKYANLAINCDVSIYKKDDGFHFYVLGNLSRNEFVIPTINEAINECLWLRTLGVQIPDHIINKLRNVDVQSTDDRNLTNL